MAKHTKRSASDNAPPAAETSASKPTGKARSTVKKSAASSAEKAPAKKVTAKKATPKKATPKKAATKKAAPKKAAPTTSKPTRPTDTGKAKGISAEARHRLIAEAAYLRGESVGFLSDEKEDWLLAEAEVDARLRKANIRVVD